MDSILLGIILVLAVIYIVPIVVYGTFSSLLGIKTPAGVSPKRFLVSVLVSKFGTAISFVLIFYFTRSSLTGQWFLYAFIWWVMFVIDEVGQTVGPNYSRKEALAGIISETIYFPAPAYIVDFLIKV